MLNTAIAKSCASLGSKDLRRLTSSDHMAKAVSYQPLIVAQLKGSARS